MYYISIWMVWGYYWDPQIRADQEKKIWGPLLYNVSSYCVHALLEIVTFSYNFWHLFYQFWTFFSAYMGLFSAPAGW